jgi:hypothetical protein
LLLLPVVWLMRFIGCLPELGPLPSAPLPVTISSPAAGAVFFGGPLTVTAAASTGYDTKIVSLQFQLDGSDFGPPLAPPSPVGFWVASVTVDTSTLSEGAHEWKAVATDSASTKGESAVTIQVRIPKPLITGFTPGTLRSDRTGWAGMQITVGPAPILVHALGRLHVSGNSRNHAVKLAVGGARPDDVLGAIVTTSPGALPEDQFVYAPLAMPLTLNAGEPYFLVSYEEVGGDSFFDNDSHVTPDKAVKVDGPESDQPWSTDLGKPNQSYGLVNLKFTPGP